MLLKPPNTKLNKSKYKIYTFSLPAVKTCPGASHCIPDCYATRLFFQMPNVKASHSQAHELSKSENFARILIEEINAMRKKPSHIRIHPSGDFYSEDYLNHWLNVASAFPEITFYGYTKSVRIFKNVKGKRSFPDNFRFVYSLGGRYDALIDKKKDSYAQVFASEAIIPKHFINATHDDLLVLTGERIGLAARPDKKPVNAKFVTMH
jgi:hypothetical protein